MKKLFKALCACILALTLCVGNLVGCNNASNGGANQILNFDRAFYYTAIGGIGLFNSGIENEDSILSGNSGLETYSETETLSIQEEKKLVANVAIAASTFDRDVDDKDERNSDKSPYELTKKVIVCQSGTESTEYDFYYNKTSYKIDDSGDIKLDGVVIVNGDSENIYIIEGKKQIEFGETDIDIFLYAPVRDDDGNVVLGSDNKPKRDNTQVFIEQKFQAGKQAFRYTYDFDGERIVETTAVYEKVTSGEIVPYFFTTLAGKTVYYNFNFITANELVTANAFIRENNAVTEELLATVTINQSGYTITYPAETI
ncbi:MAG: hypothetical protein IJV95_04385 [Clostridia bacterium]|nr:hypothetical protein [Clostridia bacterium]